MLSFRPWWSAPKKAREISSAGWRFASGFGVLLLALTGGAALSSPPASITGPAPTGILPLPASSREMPGSFRVSNGATIASATGDPAAAAAARLLSTYVRVDRGLTLRPVVANSGAIRLIRQPSILAPEGYRLTVSSTGVTIEASTDQGLRYGAISLAQLLSPDRAFEQPVMLQAQVIDDAPRFAWRGVMIDVARHFQPIESLHAIVDAMAHVKLNTLHLHLTDDQGWRMEIKRYPQLTAIGAYRTPPSTGGAPGARVGGFYTQTELKALVKHAASVGIVIVPEIDLPGHAQALVAAYPARGVMGDSPPVWNGWGVSPYLLNPDPEGIAFVEHVLDEVMAIFPGTYIHLGGDEAIKDQWQRSPAVQAQIAALGLKDENELQSWLIGRFDRYLAAHGRRLIGWDEILDGALPSSASVMSWRGEKGAIAAANAGHMTVLSPMPKLYFDNLQSDAADEPPGRRSIQTLADVYRYDPMPAAIAPDKARFVLGAQANVWSEYLATPYQIQHMLFPRAAALAEITWSPAADRDFPGFVARLDPQIERWRRRGIHVADSAFAVRYTLAGTRADALRTGNVTVVLATQAPTVAIRYTLDGATPTASSPLYSAPLSVRTGVRIRAIALAAGGGIMGAVRDFDTGRAALLTRRSAELGACPGSPPRLRAPMAADGDAMMSGFDINLLDMCSTYPEAPLARATGLAIDVVRLPRETGLAHDSYRLKEPFAVTRHGELIVSTGCPAIQGFANGNPVGPKPRVIASFVLPDPTTTPQRLHFAAPLPKGVQDHDLCLQFTAPLSAPYYAIDRITLTEAKR